MSEIFKDPHPSRHLNSRPFILSFLLSLIFEPIIISSSSQLPLIVSDNHILREIPLKIPGVNYEEGLIQQQHYNLYLLESQVMTVLYNNVLKDFQLSFQRMPRCKGTLYMDCACEL